MKTYILKSVILWVGIFIISCSKDDKKTMLLPTQIEIEFPAATAGYQTLDITYNNQFLIETVTRNLPDNSKIIYTCGYNDQKQLTNLKIERTAFDDERNYQIQYINGYLSKVIETTASINTEYEISYNSNTNTYKYNFPYTWKFDNNNDLAFYYFSSITAFEVTYTDGNAFNYFMPPQPALAILDSYFAENFYADLFFLSQKPIAEMRYEDLISSDIAEYHYTNIFNSNNKLIRSEIRYNSDANPSIIKNVTYQEISY